jgi:hypothetical protein
MSDFIGQLAPGAQKICQQPISFARNFPPAGRNSCPLLAENRAREIVIGPRSAVDPPGKTRRVPRISGQKTMILNDKTRSARRGPPRPGAGARAMFLSNIYINFRLAYNYPIKQYIIP